MTEGLYRIGIVGASSLLGRELADEVGESLLAASTVVLLDAEGAVGKVTAVGDEAAVVQTLEEDSFTRMDFVFFTGSGQTVEEHWEAARTAGAGIVDLTYALEEQRGVPVRAPMIFEALGRRAEGQPGLETHAVVSAHPAAVMLGMVAARMQQTVTVTQMAATVLEPASEYGREAMDELHQQTVNLLAFKDLPKEQFDAQVAFNLLPVLGESAKVTLAETIQRIRRHYGQIGGGLPPLDLQVVQAPVFHGYVASVLVELAEQSTEAQVEMALAGEGIDVVSEDSDPPSNLSAAGQEDVMVRVRSAAGPGAAGKRFWLWLGADNLKLAARNAISCANELRRVRPTGKVQ